MSRTPQRRLGGSGLSSSVLVSSNRPQPEPQVILPPNSPDGALMQIFRSFSRDTVLSTHPSRCTNSEICCHYRPDCPVPNDYHSPSYPDKNATNVKGHPILLHSKLYTALSKASNCGFTCPLRSTSRSLYGQPILMEVQTFRKFS